jgi:hypothetical protein
MKQLLVDYSHIGYSGRFEMLLFAEERLGIEPGDVVELVGDGNPARRAVLEQLEGSQATFRFLDPVR